MKILLAFHETDQRLFRGINRHFKNKILNTFFQVITHTGGARITITSILLLIILTDGPLMNVAVSSAIALALSHLPVQIMKKWYPRKRPYIILKDTFFPANPLKDHSFPSGHSTAIFSLVVPFIFFMPVLAIFLVPLAILVGISRVYLGLHFPTDVLVGAFLGTTAGFLSYFSMF
jgi:undecaprenyl-diphosphatase